MARHGRYFLANQPLHVIQRGNNREPAFFHEDDYHKYKEWLTEAAAQYGCSVHAHVLMTNHVHLLVTPEDTDALPRTMQSLGRRYVRYANRMYRRTGTLWEGRYRACPIDSDEYFFSCCRYIELNPVRAGMVGHPRDYRWSSYRAHAEGKQDALAPNRQFFAGWAAAARSGKSATGICSGSRSKRALSTSCVRPPMEGGPLAVIGSGAKSQKRSTGAWRHFPQAALPSL